MELEWYVFIFHDDMDIPIISGSVFVSLVLWIGEAEYWFSNLIGATTRVWVGMMEAWRV